ncbi:MAG: hypothetical protein JO033_13575 [Acidobacteriaceae bacterium]|nr:hypothetical protein [Acidobacteriaceae bacterium]MBV9498428.1 hypothetical protein [Acidobacteriaceae bacterium]
MSNNLSHEDIAKRFIEAKVVDFGAMGKFITELGPVLAVSDSGWHGINLGRFNILACMLPPADVTRLVGNLRTAALTASVLEGAAEASLPK